MDMTNIKDGNGFIHQGDLLMRMHRSRPVKGDPYVLRRLPGRVFSQVGIMAMGKYLKPMFLIYTGNKELYEFVREKFEATASALGYKSQADDWKDEDA